MPHPATLFSNLTFGGFKQPSLGFSLWCCSWVTFKITLSYSWFLSIRITAEKVWQVHDCLSDNVALDSLVISLLDSYRKLNQVDWSLYSMNWSVFYSVALANAIPTVSKLEVSAIKLQLKFLNNRFDSLKEHKIQSEKFYSLYTSSLNSVPQRSWWQTIST